MSSAAVRPGVRLYTLLLPVLLAYSSQADTIPPPASNDTTSVQNTITHPDSSDTLAEPDTIPASDSTVKPDTLPSDALIRPDTLVTPATAAVSDTTPKPDTTTGSPAPPESLFTGILPKQDMLARTYVHEVYAFRWKEAERTLKKLQRFERKNRLLPLSGLLAVSSRTVRVLGGEFENDDEKQTLLDEINNLRRKTLRQVTTSSLPDSLVPLALFIAGGIKGLVATLKIETAIVEAALEGYDALRKLEKVIERVPDHADPYLGTGIFYCLLAKSPGIVRAALNLTGRNVTFEKGLDFLRKSAAHGRYTSETAMLYLIRFLSPYWGHLRQEKTAIFNELERRYPENPYYTFLRLDEIICFHPQSMSRIDRDRIAERKASWKRNNFSLRRYAALVDLQLQFIDDYDKRDSLTDRKFDLREFSFYPLFLTALDECGARNKRAQPRRHAFFSKSESAALRALGLSDMTTTRRNFYEWHIRDALKLCRKSAPPQDQDE